MMIQLIFIVITLQEFVDGKTVKSGIGIDVGNIVVGPIVVVTGNPTSKLNEIFDIVGPENIGEPIGELPLINIAQYFADDISCVVI